MGPTNEPVGGRTVQMVYWSTAMFSAREMPRAFFQHFEVQRYGPDGCMKMTVLLDGVDSAGHVLRRGFEVTRHYAEPDETVAELREAGSRKSNSLAASAG